MAAWCSDPAIWCTAAARTPSWAGVRIGTRESAASGWPIQTAIWVSGRLPAFAAALSAAELMMIAAVIPRARLIAARAAAERAW